MYAPQRYVPEVYTNSPYGIPAYAPVVYSTTSLDVNWSRSWPKLRSLLLAAILVTSGVAIIGLDIANLAIEGNKQNETSQIGLTTDKVGAGIWSGSVSVFAAGFIIAIVFVSNKRVAATFALLAVTMAFLCMVVLVGLVGNAVQNFRYVTDRTDADKTQQRILVSMLAVAGFILLLCAAYFVLYITVFFSRFTRLSSRRQQ